MEPENNSQKKIGIVISLVVVLGILAITIFANNKETPVAATDQTSSDTSNTPATTPSTDTTPPIDTPKKPVSVYKDGHYSATGTYMSPGGADQIAVTLTLKNDIITNITVTPEPGDGTSARYENIFVSGYKSLVVGKNIANVNLSKVSGSSLTSRGFNDAIAQIKTQAKA